MENRTNPTQLFMDANRKLGELEDIISSRLKNTLAEFNIERPVGCSFDREYYQMKIFIEEREYTISVQGRGVEIEKYYEKMLEIINKEVKLNG